MMWLATEILFNFVEIDDLADYSEFLLENNYDNNGLWVLGWDIYAIALDENWKQKMKLLIKA